MGDIKQYKILLVDDRKENLIALSAVLNNSGYKSDSALSGEDALKLLLKNDYGLLILDVQMPGMNGFELAELIKGNSRTKDIPLIFLSANAIQKDFFTKGHEAGALDYMTKPVDEKLFLLKVKNLLDIHHSKNRLEKQNQSLEENAKQAKISYQDLYYSLTQEVFIINESGFVVSINRTGELCCGLHIFDLIGRHYSNSGYLKAVLNDFNLSDFLNQKTNEPKQIEFKFLKENGTDYFGNATITQTLIDGEKHIQISISDITEKKKAEERIMGSESRLRVAQKMAKIGDWWYDIASGEVIWSDEMYNIYNCNRETFFPNISSLIELIHEDDKPLLKSWIENLSYGKKNDALIFRVVNSDKSIKYVLGDGEIIFDESGVPKTAVGTAQDITHLREIQEELKKTIENLNNRCNELMQFNYIVSHNLRAPVATIMGLSNLINYDSDKRNEQLKIIDYIRTAVINMDEQIKHLNLILSTRSGLNEKIESVVFSDIIKNIKDTFEYELIASGTKIKVDVHPSANEIFSIRSYLESIFYNLISNAIKFKSPQHQQKVEVKVNATDTKFLITVSDTGIGIDLDKYGSEIFGLYKRFNFDKEGKGLGLHMVKTQVESLGGKIEVQSQLNSGTIFTITLPR